MYIGTNVTKIWSVQAYLIPHLFPATDYIRLRAPLYTLIIKDKQGTCLLSADISK